MAPLLPSSSYCSNSRPPSPAPGRASLELGRRRTAAGRCRSLGGHLLLWAAVVAALFCLLHAAAPRPNGPPALVEGPRPSARSGISRRMMHVAPPSSSSSSSPAGRQPGGLSPQQQAILDAGVDVVYLWVNGSDPRLARELQDAERREAKAAEAAARSLPRQAAILDAQLSQSARSVARFDAARDELRYSLRSLAAHMPWVRHVWIVTNGQVPSWLDVGSQRVTVVPHETIFPPELHQTALPNFNSFAIQSVLANIPGLAPSWVLMDDDFFLTQPWSVADFVGADGAQVVTGSTLANRTLTRALAGNGYVAALSALERSFASRFGPWRRYDPPHSPHFIQTSWLRRMMAETPELWSATASHTFRQRHDAFVAAAYEWYVDQFQPGAHARAPDERSAFATLGAGLTDVGLDAAKAEWAAAHNHTGAPHANTTSSSSSGADDDGVPHLTEAQEDAAIAEAGAALAAGRPVGPHLENFVRRVAAIANIAWRRPHAKAVCLNDDVPLLLNHARPVLDPAVTRFLAATYPTPSEYELPHGARNTCSGRVKAPGFKQLPTADEWAAACPPAKKTGNRAPRLDQERH